MDSKAAFMDHSINIKGPVHLIGICGIGMTGLCAFLKSAGYTVSGSDINSVSASKRIHGVTYYSCHNPELVEQAETIIYSSAIQDDNPEIIRAKQLGKTLISRGKALSIISLAFKHCIAIAGTHGKTTISCLLSHLLIEAKLDPSYYVGGLPKNNFLLSEYKSSNIFITETDESDGSFLLLSPSISVISNIDNDHLSFYKSCDNIKKAFSTFIDHQVKRKKTILLNAECHTLNTLSPQDYQNCKMIGNNTSYGLHATSIHYSPEGLRFDVMLKTQCLGTVQTKLYGKHNVENILLAIAVCLDIDIPFETIQSGLKLFLGTQQRMDFISNDSPFQIIQDYAHHPAAIRATLSAVKQHFKKKTVVVFQPHRYSRLKSFFEDFTESFTLADHLFITPVYSANETAIPHYTSRTLVDNITQKTKQAATLLEDNYDTLLDCLEPDTIVLFLGAGNIRCIANTITSLIEERTTSRQKAV